MDGPQSTSALCVRVHRDELGVPEQQPRLRGLCGFADGDLPRGGGSLCLCFRTSFSSLYSQDFPHRANRIAARQLAMGPELPHRSDSERQSFSTFVVIQGSARSPAPLHHLHPRVAQPIDARVREVVVKIAQLGGPASPRRLERFGRGRRICEGDLGGREGGLLPCARLGGGIGLEGSGREGQVQRRVAGRTRATHDQGGFR